MFIGQHAGGGKAEQIFLRGFDIDHGTDIAITADGIPVNMVSHAHGQGYADLHFIIPETIESVDFGLGPYHASKGNFNTAGYVDFAIKKKISDNLIKLEAGQFQTTRLMAMFKLLDNDNSNAYLASEYLISNGPFESPQNFQRANVLGSYTKELSESSTIDVSLSHFFSSWTASGQIPQRAVDSGRLTRFGAIDDTEGGTTSRSNFIFGHKKYLSANSFIKSKVYLSKYDFELFSNFTFFLEDPVNGDQILQEENRYLYGLTSEYTQSIFSDRFVTNLSFGVSLRADNSNNNRLANTFNRTTILNNIQFGDITEHNLGLYANAEFDFGKVVVNPSLRFDNFNYAYLDLVVNNQSRLSDSKSIISPKLNVQYNVSRKLQFYTKLGKGFHSNDARSFLISSNENTIPAAYGFDVGAIWKPLSRLFVNATYWNLFLEQEFVYVGDAGIVEPSGETFRRGFDLSLRYQQLEWLFFNSDINYTIAISTNEEEGNDFIPLAPDFTVKTGFTLKHPSGFSSSLNVKHIDDRPANEDNSIIAVGYTVVDLSANYDFGNLSVGFQIQNLFDKEWNETQFATESRLLSEPESVEEIHFTPGTPLFLKGIVQYSF